MTFYICSAGISAMLCDAVNFAVVSTFGSSVITTQLNFISGVLVFCSQS